MAGGTLRTYPETTTPEKHMPMDIVSSVLHELQTPIAAILITAENIRDGLLQDRDRLREEGTSLVAHATRLMTLGDQILLYARTGRPELRHDVRALTAGEVIHYALDNVATLLRQSGFTLEREIQAGLPSLRGDLQLLSQCLENLIANAVKYSGQSRWVGVSAFLAQSSVSGREEICIRVCDRGLGISADDLPYIFEPFYRSRRPAVFMIRGNGLGLSIAKGCVEACGGTLSVVSQEGAGCVFTLHLQLYGTLAAEETEPCVGPSDDGQPVRDFKVDQPGSPFLAAELIGIDLVARQEHGAMRDDPGGEHPRVHL